ncbi:MAG: hypothetical protein K2X29_09840 [Candidatus Obscuribacterales bacterium]|nr:hypothetical protein [Candidatus Obscuribacterales bacterium]
MTIDEPAKNSFGAYLKELRRSRGFANINEYLRSYPVPMSHVHYRHLESGNRNTSIDSAKELCEALRADTKVFYFNLLKDWLPEEFMDFFVTLSSEANSPQSKAERESVKRKYQKAVMQALDSQVLFPSAEACDYLDERFELLPIVWFVYSVAQASLRDIERIAEKNGISVNIEKTVEELTRLGVLSTEKSGNKVMVARMRPSICFSHHDLGLRILQHETRRSLSQYVLPRNPQLKESVLILSVMSASQQTRKIIFQRIQDFVRQIREGAEVSFKSGAKNEPVFYSITFAPCKRYAAKPVSGEA